MCVSKDLQGKNIEGEVQFLKVKFVSHLGVLVMLDVQDRILVAWFKSQGEVVQKTMYQKKVCMIRMTRYLVSFCQFIWWWAADGFTTFLCAFHGSFQLIQAHTSGVFLCWNLVPLQSGYLGCKKNNTALDWLQSLLQSYQEVQDSKSNSTDLFDLVSTFQQSLLMLM